MGLFKDLIKSKFLANAVSELALARNSLLKNEPLFINQYTHIFNTEMKKDVYDYYLNAYGFAYDLVDASYEEDDMIYYIHEEDMIFIFSRSKRQIDNSIKYSFNINGDIPVYRGKHRVKSRLVHTVLIDTKFCVRPPSAN